MPRTECIRTAEKHSISHLASAARQSASYPELPFKGMEGPRDPQLISVALDIHGIFPRAEWIRVKHLSNGRIVISIKAAGMKAHARGYGHANAQSNLIRRIASLPRLREAILS